MSQTPEEGLKPTATPGYSRNFRDLNEKVSQGKSFSGYERNPFFLNREGRGFSELAGLLGVNYDDDSRAVATVDWDRDGDLDMWVTNRTAPQVRLLKNNFPKDRSFVAVRLIGNGKNTNKDAIGARLTLSSESESKQMRTVRAGDGFLAQSSAWSHFGVGKNAGQTLSLKVDWPGGDAENYSGLIPGGRYVVTQGQGKWQVPVLPLELVSKVDAEVTEHVGAGFWVANQVPFPNLEYKDEKAAMRSTADFEGAPVLVNLWATWCLPCLEELAMFGKYADQLRAQGVAVLALNVDGLAVDGSAGSASATATAKDVLAKAGYSLPHGFAQQDNLAMIELLIEHLTSRKEALSIPMSFLVDAKGNVAAVYRETLNWEQLSADLALLNASPDEQLKRASPRPGRWFADPRQLDRESFLSGYATLFAANGFPQEAQRLYAIAKPGGSDLTAQEYYNQAKSAAQQGEQKKAMEFYRAALQLDPEYGQALTGLGALLLMQKKVDDAQPLFEKALELDPNHATALINMAMIDQARGNKESALKRLQQVIARNPGYAEAHLNLGSLLASMNRYDEAIDHLSTAVTLNPKREVAHLNLAAAYVETEQFEKAEKRYLEVQKMNPRMAYAHLGMGLLQARRNEHAAAVTSFGNALKLGAASPKLLTQLGHSFQALGDHSNAVEAFRQALKLDSGYGEAERALEELKVP